MDAPSRSRLLTVTGGGERAAGEAADDRILVHAVLGGDVAQFEQLVGRYQQRVYRFLVRTVGDAHAAEDLAQDTFVSAFRSLASFRGEARFSTWLLGIALNLGRNYVSRVKIRRRQRETGPPSVDWPDSTQPPSTVAAERLALDVVREALGELPDDLREPLVLVSLEGCAYDEVARLLGVPLGTVKSRVFAAREALRQAMARQGVAR